MTRISSSTPNDAPGQPFVADKLESARWVALGVIDGVVLQQRERRFDQGSAEIVVGSSRWCVKEAAPGFDFLAGGEVTAFFEAGQDLAGSYDAQAEKVCDFG